MNTAQSSCFWLAIAFFLSATIPVLYPTSLLFDYFSCGSLLICAFVFLVECCVLGDLPPETTANGH